MSSSMIGKLSSHEVNSAEEGSQRVSRPFLFLTVFSNFLQYGLGKFWDLLLNFETARQESFKVHVTEFRRLQDSLNVHSSHLQCI